MLIKRIEIEKLHGDYDYVIKFNPQLTFLYGANGCGKTTVLNILTAIITGKLYKLLDYRFNKIILSYGSTKDQQGNISITMLGRDKIAMEVMFDNQRFLISDIDELKERMYETVSENESIDRYFFSTYPIANDIANTFNYVYLPLNRFGSERNTGADDYYRYFYTRKRYLDINRGDYNSYLNDSLSYISELVRSSCMEMNVKENMANDEFRMEVLKSMIRVSSDMEVLKIMNEIGHIKWGDVEKLKKSYIKTLEEIGVYDNMIRDIDKFFNDFKKAYAEYSDESDSQEGHMFTVNLAWQYTQLKRIQKIAELASDNEKRKDKIRQPRFQFVNVINDFFLSSGTHKRVMISNEGIISFDASGKQINIKDLSSGEKQIIIIFASLIFGLKSGKTGIYIVDEPEASLHLEWQSKFVSSILDTTEGIQLIFATHSPELIGHFRKNAVRLELSDGV